MQVKASAVEEALRRLRGGNVEMSSQSTLEDPPPPEFLNRAPNELYELLVDLTLRGFVLTAAEDILVVRPKSGLAAEEMALLLKYKAEAIAWIAGMEEHRKATRHIEAAIEEWLEEDEDAQLWVRTLPERGEDYVKAQLWQVLAELRARGILVPRDEEEVVVFLMIEAAWRLVREEG